MAPVMTPPEQAAPGGPASASGRRGEVRDETSVDSAAWLEDMRQEFRRLGVLRLGPNEWTAVWGKTWRINAVTAIDLYAQLRAAGLPYGRRDHT
jgi:hypothetical protein